jgi:large subunit ribosomal protein L30
MSSAKASSRLRVRQVASTIGRAHPQERVIRGLGLRGRGTTVLVDNTPSFRGMIKKVLHLVTVEEEKS